MDSLQTLFQTKIKVPQVPQKDTPRGPNSARADVVQKVCDFMNDQRFAYWLGRTKTLKPEAIYLLLREAEGGKNKPAFFNFLLKKELGP